MVPGSGSGKPSVSAGIAGVDSTPSYLSVVDHTLLMPLNLHILNWCWGWNSGSSQNVSCLYFLFCEFSVLWIVPLNGVRTECTNCG